MPQWKVKLEGDENTIGALAQNFTDKEACVRRDGVEWYLESTQFEYFTDHNEVKAKASEIVSQMLQSGKVAGAGNISLTKMVRIHYDNSKSVFT